MSRHSLKALARADRRARHAFAVVSIAAAVAIAGPAAAQAQAPAAGAAPQAPASQTPTPQTPAPQAGAPDHDGWKLSITPYLWLPHVSGNASFATADFGVRDLSARIGPESYLKDMRFAAMLSGEARKDNFLIATDLIYLNLGGSSAKVTSVTLPGLGSVPVTDAGTKMSGQSVIWTAAGGYSLLRNETVQLDALVGFRFMAMSSTINWNVSAFNGAVSRGGSVSRNTSLMDGIVGLKGRIRIPESNFYLPFYADIGAAPASFTWQVMGGVGYSFGWGDVSVAYRYLQFQTTDNRPIQRLGMGGPELGIRIPF